MTQVNPSSERPLLTIAIPTYNRWGCLKQLLEILAPQLAGESRVELIVSDNASPDDTPDVVASFREKGLALIYNRNEKNLGADANIVHCFEMARGEYVWIFGDDDLIAPGTINRVLHALSSQRYDIVCIRAYFYLGNYVQHKNYTPVPDLDLTTAEEFARHVHVMLTFISGIIVNKEYISSMSHPPFKSLLKTNLIQLGPYYTALNHLRRGLLIRDPLIAATGNSHVGYALYRTFGPTLTQITSEWVEMKSVQRAIINGTIQTFFPYFLLLTRQSVTSSVSEDPHQILRLCFGKNLRYWIFDYPICILPLPFAKIWFMVVRAINKVDRLCGNPLVNL
jgi:glycosyltransferase involved in cell wall biosynthesis